MKPTTIFLADGQKFVRDAIRLKLDDQPEFSIIGEADSKQVLVDTMDGLAPDVLLMDWFLPAMDPKEILKTLRQHSPDTTIIATSVRPEMAHHIQQFDVDGFLSKQLSPDQFVDQLKELVEKKEENEKSTHSGDGPWKDPSPESLYRRKQ